MRRGVEVRDGQLDAPPPQVPNVDPREMRRLEIIDWMSSNLLLHQGGVPRADYKVIWPKACKKQPGKKGKTIVKCMYKSLREGYGRYFGGVQFMDKLSELNKRVAESPSRRENGPTPAEFFNLLAVHIIEVSDVKTKGPFDYKAFFNRHNLTKGAYARMEAEVAS